jgi:sec-independent protein translocase protein TatB
MLLDIGSGEFLVLLVLAAILIGPDKLPELARKLARVVNFLRGVANDTTGALRAELGPEFADLSPRDLQPTNLLNRLARQPAPPASHLISPPIPFDPEAT